MKRTLLLTAAVFAVTLGIGVWAHAPRLLPLDNLGLEYLDIVVPDTAASARFYARIIKTKLHQQPGARHRALLRVARRSARCRRPVRFDAEAAAGSPRPKVSDQWRILSYDTAIRRQGRIGNALIAPQCSTEGIAAQVEIVAHQCRRGVEPRPGISIFH